MSKKEQELIDLMGEMAQRMLVMNSRVDALQAALIATMTALAKSSPAGGASIEKLTIIASENLCQSLEAKGQTFQSEQLRGFVETILLTVRIAISGKPEPR